MQYMYIHAQPVSGQGRPICCKKDASAPLLAQSRQVSTASRPPLPTSAVDQDMQPQVWQVPREVWYRTAIKTILLDSFIMHAPGTPALAVDSRMGVLSRPGLLRRLHVMSDLDCDLSSRA